MDIVTNDVLQDAFVLSMVSYAASLSLSKIYAKKHHYTVRANQVRTIRKAEQDKRRM